MHWGVVAVACAVQTYIPCGCGCMGFHHSCGVLGIGLDVLVECECMCGW